MAGPDGVVDAAAFNDSGKELQKLIDEDILRTPESIGGKVGEVWLIRTYENVLFSRGNNLKWHIGITQQTY